MSLKRPSGPAIAIVDRRSATKQISNPDVDEHAAAQPIPLPVAGASLHPLDLIKDPFTYKGQQITLEVWSLPILVNGRIWDYSRRDENFDRIGVSALEFVKRISEDESLYRVNGVNADANYSSYFLGQIVFVVSPTEPAPLEFDRDWVVEPLGLVQGTNLFGAAISVPLVRFLRYSTRPGEMSEEQEARIRASGTPICISCPHPKFPAEVLQSELRGAPPPEKASVTLKITVLPDGTVAPNPKVVSSAGPAFDKSAVEGASAWRFKPATDAQGKPIAATMSVDVSFR